MKRRFRRIFGITLLFLTLVAAIGSVTVLGQGGKAQASELPSLREIYQDYFEIGAAVSIAGWSSKTFDRHRELIKHQFSSLTAENEMKPEALQPGPGNFRFTDADRMVDFAVEQGMKVRGHTLVWHAQTGDWFFRDGKNQLIYEKDVITEADRQLVIDRLENHIEVVMEHFGDKVYAWDVVNEAVSDGGGAIHRPDSPWFQILGDDFMKIAFTKAHEVNPNVKLFYNDYNPEMAYKRGRTIKMLEDLLADGVPVHGIGIQGHWSVDGTTIKEIEQAIRMYADLGLEIHITEMDVGMEGFTEEQQAERYRELFQLFKKHSDVITSVTIWGITDDASWRRDENPLLFDGNGEPKPAFWALVDTDKPWYVNKAEYTNAVEFFNSAGEMVGALKPGDYNLNELDSLGFNLAEVTGLQVEKGHLITFFEQEGQQGTAWHFITTEDFAGGAMATQAKSLSIASIETDNIALNKPTKANVLGERAHRAVDGEKISSWSPSAEPPYWLEVDLEGTYLLSRWVVRLHGTGPLAGEVEESPFNAADFSLQISDDGVNWQDVDVVEGNTASICDRDLNLVKASYVRLYVTRPTSVDRNNSLAVYEFEVYGTVLD